MSTLMVNSRRSGGAPLVIARVCLYVCLAQREGFSIIIKQVLQLLVEEYVSLHLQVLPPSLAAYATQMKSL